MELSDSTSAVMPEARAQIEANTTSVSAEEAADNVECPDLAPAAATQAEPAAGSGPLMMALRARTVVKLVWRFYMDGEQHWRWQRLTVAGHVVSQSQRNLATYDECMLDASHNGYCFEPSQPRVISGRR